MPRRIIRLVLPTAFTTTRKVMEAATGQCRMIVVNRIDAPGVDFAALMERITASFGKECLPINLPTAGGAGVIDCFFKPDYAAAAAFSSVRDAHDRIVDQVVEVDEELMALYLEQGESLQPSPTMRNRRMAASRGRANA